MKVTKTRCGMCRTSFEHPAWQRRKFCSRSCANRSVRVRNVARRGRDAPNWRGGKVTSTCPQCGRAFDHWPGERRTYCSRPCVHAYLRTLVGQRRYNAKGPKRLMYCVVCGTAKLVRFSLQSRFRTCSRRCAAQLGRWAVPRISAIEEMVERALRTRGLSPVPQVVIGRHLVDLALVEERVAVECDGDYWHGSVEQQRRDDRKTREVQAAGWTLVRLSEADIRRDLARCVGRILAAHTAA